MLRVKPPSDVVAHRALTPPDQSTQALRQGRLVAGTNPLNRDGPAPIRLPDRAAAAQNRHSEYRQGKPGSRGLSRIALSRNSMLFSIWPLCRSERLLLAAAFGGDRQARSRSRCAQEGSHRPYVRPWLSRQRTPGTWRCCSTSSAACSTATSSAAVCQRTRRATR